MPTDAPPPAIAKRRARNRASQRTFRERQARYMKELEKKVAEASQSESLRLRSAQQEVQRLREALTATKSRALSLAGALEGVAASISTYLDSKDGDLTSSSTLDDDEHPAEVDEEVTESVENELGEEQQAQEPNQNAQQPTIVVDSGQVSSGQVSSGQVSNRSGPMSALFQYSPAGTQSRPDHAMRADKMQPSADNFDGLFGLDIVNNLRLVPNASLSTLWGSADFEGMEGDQGHQIMAPISADAGQTNPFWETSSTQTALFPSQAPAEKPNYPNMEGYPPGVASFPSVFAAHLAVCEFFTRQNQVYKDRGKPNGDESLSKLVSRMVDMFVNTAWPDMRIWWAYIQSSKVVEKLMRWKIDPCIETYKALPVSHRPTALQMCTAHPSIIDWAFFPSIRDRLIELYSHSWMLDEIVCELVAAYVVEADLAKIVTGMENHPAQKGYFRIWDIVQTISRDDPSLPGSVSLWADATPITALFTESSSLFEINDDGGEETWTRMPLEKIFCSQKAALKLFNLLRMDDRRAVKLDPLFAIDHPELCDDPGIIASGLDCTLRGQKIEVPHPKPLTREAIINYKMMISKANL
ncbi:hypothetical protein V496_02089 [Pseudogymnoascus sp. VKM F-4515 (FW-2607)]|nr:hypothetical protein V496_02089 [Pseudogymnoascus sp. VKM F-4515 (FW-2607)]